jgi:hypothetical protein
MQNDLLAKELSMRQKLLLSLNKFRLTLKPNSSRA